MIGSNQGAHDNQDILEMTGAAGPGDRGHGAARC